MGKFKIYNENILILRKNNKQIKTFKKTFKLFSGVAHSGFNFIIFAEDLPNK
jgi:hypothetical protein